MVTLPGCFTPGIIADVATAISFTVAVEDLLPEAAFGHADVVTLPDNRGEVATNQNRSCTF